MGDSQWSHFKGKTLSQCPALPATPCGVLEHYHRPALLGIASLLGRFHGENILSDPDFTNEYKDIKFSLAQSEKGFLSVC